MSESVDFLHLSKALASSLSHVENERKGAEEYLKNAIQKPQFVQVETMSVYYIDFGETKQVIELYL